MSEVLIAGDSSSLLDVVEATIASHDVNVRRATSGRDVLGDIRESGADLVILDLQIGSMGGVAVSIQLAQEIQAGRLEHVPVLLLLDRDADRQLAKMSRSDGWIVKPIDVFELRRLTTELLAGESSEPETVEPQAAPDDTDESDEALASAEPSQ